MELEVLVMILMFAVAGVGFISAINSRGTVRTVLSYILATLILISSLYTVVNYNNEKMVRELAKKEAILAEKARQEELLKQQKAEEEARAAAELAAQANAGNAQMGVFQQQLSVLANKGLDIARAILAAPVDGELSDDAFEALKKKAGGYKFSAGGLKKDIETKISGAPAGTDVSALKEILDKAVRELNTAAHNLNLYFKAEGPDEENERYDAYQLNGKAAKADFTRALDKLSGK